LSYPKHDIKRLFIFFFYAMLEAKKQIELAREKEIDPHTVGRN
jgi:hypothetical protein